MRIEIVSKSMLDVNTYFVIEDNKCLVIDPGSEISAMLKLIDKQHLEVVGVILTHAHFDHFLYCNELIQYFEVPVYVHQNALELLYDEKKNLSVYVSEIDPFVLNEKIVVRKVDEATKEIEGFKLNILHVPGHSADDICLYFKDEKVVLSGDTLFRLSIGRSDLYKGNEKQLKNNIKNKLLSLPPDTVVYPGHGEETTIAYEKKHNLYLK